MKDFLKFTFATITGIIVASVLLILISILMIFGMASTSGTETLVQRTPS